MEAWRLVEWELELGDDVDAARLRREKTTGEQ